MTQDIHCIRRLRRQIWIHSFGPRHANNMMRELDQLRRTETTRLDRLELEQRSLDWNQERILRQQDICNKMEMFTFFPLPPWKELFNSAFALLHQVDTSCYSRDAGLDAHYKQQEKIEREFVALFGLACMAHGHFYENFQTGSQQKISIFDSIDAVYQNATHRTQTQMEALLPLAQNAIRNARPFTRQRTANPIFPRALTHVLKRADFFGITEDMQTQHTLNFRSKDEIPDGHPIPLRVIDRLVWRETFSSVIYHFKRAQHFGDPIEDSIAIGVHAAHAIKSGTHLANPVELHRGGGEQLFCNNRYPYIGIADERLQRRALRLLAHTLFGYARNGDDMNAVWQATGIIPNKSEREAILDRFQSDEDRRREQRVMDFKMKRRYDYSNKL